jgi:hypothetical protein
VNPDKKDCTVYYPGSNNNCTNCLIEFIPLNKVLRIDLIEKTARHIRHQYWYKNSNFLSEDPVFCKGHGGCHLTWWGGLNMKMAVFWIGALCSLVEVYLRFRGACCLHHQGALMMGAAGTYETSVNFYQTAWHNNPEDSHLCTCCENLKSHWSEYGHDWVKGDWDTLSTGLVNMEGESRWQPSCTLDHVHLNFMTEKLK